MKISPSDLDKLRSSVVLSDLIGKTVRLSKGGKEWKGLCPFHAENTASFTVSNEKGFYHCFGCGAHGDAIRWLTDKESMSFSDAVIYLKNLTGIEFKDQPSIANDLKNVKSGGGKLSRSETVTVRLDPKLNYLCELGARAQRRTKSSFIEWAIANSLDDVQIPVSRDWNAEISNLNDQAEQLWQVDEPDRVATLAITSPSLLTHEEQLIWKYVKENGFLWRGKYAADDRWTWQININDLLIDRLRIHWNDFKRVALEGEAQDILPKWEQHRDSLDSDIIEAYIPV